MMNTLPLDGRTSMCRAYSLLEKDLKLIFDFVEPITPNNQVYSHRIYEVFFRAATEFENIAKQILLSNGEKADTIVDYFKLVKEFRLDEYCLYSPILADWITSKTTGANLAPFQLYGGYTKYEEYIKDRAKLQFGDWYRDYNYVKHNREKYFHLATLENACMAIAAVAVVLISQYKLSAFDPYHEIVMSHGGENGTIFIPETMWTIKAPDGIGL